MAERYDSTILSPKKCRERNPIRDKKLKKGKRWTNHGFFKVRGHLGAQSMVYITGWGKNERGNSRQNGSSRIGSQTNFARKGGEKKNFEGSKPDPGKKRAHVWAKLEEEILTPRGVRS